MNHIFDDEASCPIERERKLHFLANPHYDHVPPPPSASLSGLGEGGIVIPLQGEQDVTLDRD